MLMDEGYKKLVKYEVNSIKFIRLYEYLYTYTKSEVFSTPFFGVVNPSAKPEFSMTKAKRLSPTSNSTVAGVVGNSGFRS